jgi:hypothetical protein
MPGGTAAAAQGEPPQQHTAQAQAVHRMPEVAARSRTDTLRDLITSKFAVDNAPRCGNSRSSQTSRATARIHATPSPRKRSKPWRCSLTCHVQRLHLPSRLKPFTARRLRRGDACVSENTASPRVTMRPRPVCLARERCSRSIDHIQACQEAGILARLAGLCAAAIIFPRPSPNFSPSGGRQLY